MSHFHFLRLFTFTLLAGMLVTGCAEEEPEEEPVTEEQTESVEVRPEVIFAIADDRPLFYHVESQGVVEANRQIDLVPRVSGFVTVSNIVEGRQVQRGDTLFRFAVEERMLQLREAENAMVQARNEYRMQMQSEGLLKTFADQVLQRDSTTIRITTGLAQAELNLEGARLNLSYTTITAPFSGILSAERRITPGAYIGAGTELGTLIDDGLVRIRYNVLESELARIRTGMDATIQVPGGDPVTGTVEAVSPVVDPESKTGEVIVSVPNSDRKLRPGMTVEGRISVERLQGKTRFPRSAILERDDGRTLVFKLHPMEDNEVEWIYVEPLYQNRDWVIVEHENIAPGDTIAVDQHFSLSHLQIVEPKMQFSVEEETGVAELQ